MDRDTFFKPQELRIFEVDIEGLGKVRAKELLRADRIKGYDQWLSPNGELSQQRLMVAREKMITLCLIDNEDKLLLTDADIPALRRKPSRTISQLAELAAKCLGLSEDDLSEQLKKRVGDLESSAESCEPVQNGSCT